MSVDPNLLLFSTAFAIAILVGVAALLGLAFTALVGTKALLVLVQSIAVLRQVEPISARASKPASAPTMAPDPTIYDDADLVSAIRAGRHSRYVEEEVVEPAHRDGAAYLGDELDDGKDEAPLREGGMYAGQTAS